jgi:hypothetical protein
MRARARSASDRILNWSIIVESRALLIETTLFLLPPISLSLSLSLSHPFASSFRESHGRGRWIPQSLTRPLIAAAIKPPTAFRFADVRRPVYVR